MQIPSLTIANITVPYPIIQGGMAIRISTGRLAGAVAKAGGIGVVAGTSMSEKELVDEIAKARNISTGNGALGVNILFAAANFASLVKTAMKNGIDLVVSGAGFSRDVFTWGEKYKVPVVTIVSTGRLAKMAEKLGAAAIIVEGKEAGGHLGTNRPLKDILPEVLANVKIPVIAAGGIMTGSDIKWALDAGAAGVQIGTRFAASEEAGGSKEFKKTYLAAKKGDSVLIQSPVGLPGRAIRTVFTRRLEEGHIPPKSCSACLKKCSKNFCIKTALENAQQGIFQNSLIFAGEKVDQIKEILPVQKIFDNLVSELRQA